MPYVIVPRGGKFEVRKAFGGKLVGKTSSREKARAMIRAIYASEARRNGR